MPEKKTLITAGCDLGLVSARVVILQNNDILALELLPYNNHPKQAAQEVMDAALARAGLVQEQVDFYLATGFGRQLVPFSHETVHDVGCLHRAVGEINPRIKSVIDVGGHSLQAFVMNDNGAISENISLQRCVNGTGLALENIARILEMPLGDIVAAALESENPIPITGQCVVLAESEVISQVNEGKDKKDIFAGVVSFVAGRILSVIRKVKLRKEAAFVGGVAKNSFVKRYLETNLNMTFDDLNGLDPQFISAYGAALIARDRCLLQGMERKPQEISAMTKGSDR